MKPKLTLILMALVLALNANANITEKQDSGPCSGANCLETKFKKLQDLMNDAKSVSPKDLVDGVYAGRCIRENNPNEEIAAALVFVKPKNEGLFDTVLVKGLQYTDIKEPERFQKLSRRKIKRLAEKNVQKALELKETEVGTQTIEKSAVATDAFFISTYKVKDNVLFKEDKVILSQSDKKIPQICFFYKK
jgi:hypothetical protein